MGDVQTLKPFLEPDSIAIIGASKTSGKVGYIILKNLLKYKGKIYPVNPRLDKILGLKVYPTISDVPDKVDLAIIALPATKVPDVLMECAQKNVKAAIVVAQGFLDDGETGKILQNKVDEIIKKTGIRVIGPNSLGVINTSNNLITSFIYFKKLKKGHVSIIAQTGIFCGAMLMWLSSFDFFGLSKSIDLGNKCDVDDVEVLEYLNKDPETKLIVIHMEGVKNGRKFLETAKKVTKTKPILCLKGGKTDVGARVVSTHTGSIAGLDQVYDAAFKQAGIVRVNSLNEVLDFIQAFSFSPLPKGNKVAILTFSGGVGAVVVDLCVENGLRLAKLSDETIKKLEEISPPYVAISNPVDVGPAMMSYGVKKAYPIMLKTVLEDPNVDAVISISGHFYMQFPSDWKITPETILSVVDGKVKKPLIVCTIGEFLNIEELNKLTRTFNEKGVLCYPSVETSVKVLAALYRYSKYLGYSNKE